MTTPDELDRVISHVAGELTRADASGFGERVRARLDHRRARIVWWPWAAVTVTAAILLAVAISTRAPHSTTETSIAAAPAPAPAPSVAAALAPSTEVAPRVSPRARIARAARHEPRAISPAELAWLARAVPPLPNAAPVDVPEFGITSIAPRGVDLPALVIEPLGPRDINK